MSDDSKKETDFPLGMHSPTAFFAEDSPLLDRETKGLGPNKRECGKMERKEKRVPKKMALIASFQNLKGAIQSQFSKENSSSGRGGTIRD